MLPETLNNETCGGISANRTNPNAFLVLPTIMDFLRKVALFKGKVLFVESSADWYDEVTSDQQQEMAPSGPSELQKYTV